MEEGKAAGRQRKIRNSIGERIAWPERRDKGEDVRLWIGNGLWADFYYSSLHKCKFAEENVREINGRGRILCLQ